MWFRVVCTLIDNDMGHHSGQNVTFDLVFTTISTSKHTVKENVFFSAWHIDARSIVWTLIDNGKLANQIARLAIVVKKKWLFRNLGPVQTSCFCRAEHNCNLVRLWHGRKTTLIQTLCQSRTRFKLYWCLVTILFLAPRGNAIPPKYINIIYEFCLARQK